MDAGCSARLPQAGMALGLGGIAKGWGVDQAAARLRARGARDFLVQAGGDLYAAGRPWRVAIRDPRGPPGSALAALDVRDAAFSTSGDYERFYEWNGARYHHLIDPRTCEPARASRSATVLARSATEAEILTKAAFVSGELSSVEKHGAAAVIVRADGSVLVSESLRGRLIRLGTGAR